MGEPALIAHRQHHHGNGFTIALRHAAHRILGAGPMLVPTGRAVDVHLLLGRRLCNCALECSVDFANRLSHRASTLSTNPFDSASKELSTILGAPLPVCDDDLPRLPAENLFFGF